MCLIGSNWLAKREKNGTTTTIFASISRTLFEEKRTHDFIVNQLSQLSCDIVTPVGRNGIKATFKGSENGPTIAFRADFDALPVQELNDVPYRSKTRAVCMHVVMMVTRQYYLELLK